MSSLKAILVRRERLLDREVNQMFALMDKHYEHCREEDFRRDLTSKDWVVTVRETADGPIYGFSTIVFYPFEFEGQTIRILFSGDTVIEQSRWGSLALPIGYASLVRWVNTVDPRPTYWLMISKGFRTYRIFPVFFNQFFPRWDLATPEREAALIEAVARDRFGGAYDSGAGIVRAAPGSQRLRPDLGAVTEGRKAANHDVEFFLERNPGHSHGDELVCLADFSTSNLTPFMQRTLERSAVEVPE